MFNKSCRYFQKSNISLVLKKNVVILRSTFILISIKSRRIRNTSFRTRGKLKIVVPSESDIWKWESLHSVALFSLKKCISWNSKLIAGLLCINYFVGNEEIFSVIYYNTMWYEIQLNVHRSASTLSFYIFYKFLVPELYCTANILFTWIRHCPKNWMWIHPNKLSFSKAIMKSGRPHEMSLRLFWWHVVQCTVLYNLLYCTMLKINSRSLVVVGLIFCLAVNKSKKTMLTVRIQWKANNQDF
jgi:hypothetical protein